MPASEKFYSCEFSQQAGEQLFGTATRADVWFCLEYTRPWGGEAFDESSIPDPVKQHISNALSTVPKSRLELIKRRGTAVNVQFYIAVASDQQAELYRFDFDTYDDLLELDIAAVITDALTYDQYIRERPAYLVCTNGRRDICCAKHGLPVYEAIHKQAPDLTWQCSHVGGHRFAANVVILPDGICYGRLDERAAEEVIEAYRDGQICLDHYRGRSSHDEPVQAADYFLRTETGMLGINDFRVDGVEKKDNTWVVRFEPQSGGKKHEVRVTQDKPGVQVYKTTGDPEPAWVPQYRLIGHAEVK